MRKIAFVGAGGVNSWAVKTTMEMLERLDVEGEYYIKVFDGDEVEDKNLIQSNQNYTTDDLFENKAECLAKRYTVEAGNIFITEENIEEELSIFDDIILGVDSNKVRKLIYDFCYKEKKYLLDMRAMGKQIAIYVLNHDKPWEYYVQKHFSNPEVMERKASCQMTNDIASESVEWGAKIVGHLGIEGFYLQHLRGKKSSTNEYKFMY